MTRISMRARFAPRQKWGPPPPKAMWGLGFRPMSKVSGSSKTSSSRLAEMWKKTTFWSSSMLLAADLDRPGGLAAEVHDRRHEPEHLLDGAGQQRPVGDEALPLVGVLEEGVHGPRHQVPGRLVAGHGQQQEEQLELELRQLVAVELDARSGRS